MTDGLSRDVQKGQNARKEHILGPVRTGGQFGSMSLAVGPSAEDEDVTLVRVIIALSV